MHAEFPGSIGKQTDRFGGCRVKFGPSRNNQGESCQNPRLLRRRLREWSFARVLRTPLKLAVPDRDERFRLDIPDGLQKDIASRRISPSSTYLQPVVLCLPVRYSVPVFGGA